MNDMTNIPGTTGQTMSSREIAELCEKRHDNVKRTIETLIERGVIASPQIEEKPTAGRTATEYVFSGEKGKRDSIVVVAQLSPEFTARLVDRWQELEEQARNPFAHLLPRDYPSALRALASEAEKVQALTDQVEQLQPKADALDLISAASDSMTITQASKVLSIKRAELTQWMHANNWVYRQNGSWLAYKDQIDNGRLLYKEATYFDQKIGMDVRKPYCHITPKGLTKLAKVFAGRQAGQP